MSHLHDIDTFFQQFEKWKSKVMTRLVLPILQKNWSEIYENIFSNFGNGQEVQLSKEMFREFESLEADFLNNKGIESLSD